MQEKFANQRIQIEKREKIKTIFAIERRKMKLENLRVNKREEFVSFGMCYEKRLKAGKVFIAYFKVYIEIFSSRGALFFKNS